jgi:hypothetical protein
MIESLQREFQLGDCLAQPYLAIEWKPEKVSYKFYTFNGALKTGILVFTLFRVPISTLGNVSALKLTWY